MIHITQIVEHLSVKLFPYWIIHVYSYLSGNLANHIWRKILKFFLKLFLQNDFIQQDALYQIAV